MTTADQRLATQSAHAPAHVPQGSGSAWACQHCRHPLGWVRDGQLYVGGARMLEAHIECPQCQRPRRWHTRSL